MKYTELNNNNYVLSPITFENKTIFVCKNKNSFLYDFFVYSNNNFEKVNSSLFAKLKEIYHEKELGNVAIYVAKTTTSLQKKRIVTVHNACKKIIAENITHLPKSLQTQILEKVDSVTYEFKPNSDPLIFANYEFGKHKINISFTMGQLASTDVSNILHELLHACSSSNNSTGFLIETPLNSDPNKYYRINEFVNEAYTEILRERFLVRHPDFNYSNRNISLYSPIKQMFASLIRQIDTKKLDVAYFENNGQKMLDILAEELHVENADELIRLSLLFDASFDSLKYAYGKGQNIVASCGPHVQSIVKEICTLNLNKLDKENKNINDLKYQDIFTPATQKSYVDASYNTMISTIGNYFNYFKKEYTHKQSKPSTKLSVNEYLVKYANEFVECLHTKQPLPLTFPEELKSAELFNFVLSRRLISTDTNRNIPANTEELLNVLFDPNNNYLPYDEDAQLKILATIIQNKKLPKGFGKYLPKDTFSKLLNTNLYSYVMLCKYDPLSVYEVVEKLKEDHKISKDFYLNFIKAIANTPNNIDYYINYLSVLSKDSIQKLADGGFYGIAKKYGNLSEEDCLKIHKLIYPNMHKNDEFNL